MRSAGSIVGVGERRLERRAVALGALARIVARRAGRDQERPVRRTAARAARAARGRRARPRPAKARSSAPRCTHARPPAAGPLQVRRSRPSPHEVTGGGGRVLVAPPPRRRELEPAALARLDHRAQPRDPLGPEVAEQLGVERHHRRPAARRHPLHEVLGVGRDPGGRGRGRRPSRRSPTRDGGARSAGACPGTAPPTGSRRGCQTSSIASRSSGASTTPPRVRRGACGPGRARRSSRRTPRARRPPRACRRATARARTRAARSPPSHSPKRARWAAIPVRSWSRTPVPVASSGRIAWVAAEVHDACGANAATRSPRRSSASAAAAYAPRCAPAPPPPAGPRPRCRAGATRAGPRAGTRGSAPARRAPRAGRTAPASATA